MISPHPQCERPAPRGLRKSGGADHDRHRLAQDADRWVIGIDGHDSSIATGDTQEIGLDSGRYFSPDTGL